MKDSSFSTHWIPNLKVQNGEELIRKGFLYYSVLLIPKLLFRRRTVQSVRATYNSGRQQLMDRLEKENWKSYVYLSAEPQDFILVDDQVKFGDFQEARMRLLDKMVEAVAQVARPGSVVIEFGSGDGRNLFFLKKKFPEMKFVGIEFSEVSVELSKKAAEKFQFNDVSFYCGNATEAPPSHLNTQDVVCCFSSFALEMMPGIFSKAVDNMTVLSKDLVVFFELVDELWTRDLRGMASKLRVRNLHRLRGLYPYLKDLVQKGKWKIQKAERSRIVVNPFNEMVEIQLRKINKV